MTDFLFLFRGGDMKSLSPEESQKHLQKWGEWIKGIAEKGKFKGGDPLGKGAKIISGNKKVVTDGPYAESKEMVGGYLIVSSADLNEATQEAKGCPIFEIGGATEVREIQHMDF